MALTGEQRRILLRQPEGWIALGLGSGLAPWAPGTFGSLAALLPWLSLRHLPPAWYLLVVAVTFVLGIWACGRAARSIGVHDHGALVWDEFVGQWLALLPVLLAPWYWIAAGFVLFRLLDILKPWPICWVDRRCHGGLGIMLDDLLAGAVAAVILTALWLPIGTL